MHKFYHVVLRNLPISPFAPNIHTPIHYMHLNVLTLFA